MKRFPKRLVSLYSPPLFVRHATDWLVHNMGVAIDLLTLVIVSGNCFSFVSNETSQVYRCNFSTQCCTRDSVNIPFSPSSRVTSLLTVPDTCFPFEQKLPSLQKKPVYSNATIANTTVPRRLFGPSRRPCGRKQLLNNIFRPIQRACVRKLSNTTIFSASAFREQSMRAVREFKKLRRFHFGREVPVAGICMCVAFDCALIAITCAFLNYDGTNDEEEDQGVEVFESFENLHGRLMREVQTQTPPEKPKIHVDKGVQTIPQDEVSPEERRASRIRYPHQSDC
ncbi:hypothetical protein Aduo_009730 [Ancylostoma duodenale]